RDERSQLLLDGWMVLEGELQTVAGRLAGEPEVCADVDPPFALRLQVGVGEGAGDELGELVRRARAGLTDGHLCSFRRCRLALRSKRARSSRLDVKGGSGKGGERGRGRHARLPCEERGRAGDADHGGDEERSSNRLTGSEGQAYTRSQATGRALCRRFRARRCCGEQSQPSISTKVSTARLLASGRHRSERGRGERRRIVVRLVQTIVGGRHG